MATRFRSANRQTIRQINEAVVLGAIHEHGPISRTEIAGVTNLSPATITGIMGKLIQQGLAREREAGVSRGGRPPVLVEIARDAGCVVGIKLTEDHLVAVLTDLGAAIIAERSVPLGADRSPEAVTAALAETVADLRRLEPGRRCFGVGVGLAGAIDRRAGVCRFSPFLPWRDVPLRALLEPKIGRPVVIENDVSALTLAERWFGGGAGFSDFLVVTIGRGIGLGMVLDGRPYRGGIGAGGEFGHVTIDPAGPRCDCGKFGCLEALAGEPALLGQLRALRGPETTLADGLDLAEDGDPNAAAVFAEAGATLGLALAAVVNLLNPTRVIVGAENAALLDQLLGPMKAAMGAHCFDGLFADLDLTVETWGDDAWARGAAGLVLDDIFHARLDLDGAEIALSAATRA